MKNKIKTKKAAAKRFKVTGSGKVQRYASGKRHLLEHQSSKKKRNKEGAMTVSKSDMKKVSMMLRGIS